MRPVVKPEPVEVVVIDKFTADPLVSGPPARGKDLPPAEILQAEHREPDGMGVMVHEHRVTPWLIGGLGVAGLAIVCGSMFAVGGVQAAVVGGAWLIAGYAAAWSVVWGASVLRARDDVEIEDQLHRRHGHLTEK